MQAQLRRLETGTQQSEIVQRKRARRIHLGVLHLRNNGRFITRDTIWKKALATGTALLAAGAVGQLTAPKAMATPAGLTFYPATDIYGKGNFHFDADSFGKGTRMDALVSTGLSYGIGPDSSSALGRSEVGFDYVVLAGGASPALRGSSRLLFNAKTQLYNNDESGVRVVGGFWGVGSKKIFAPNYGYVLGSKSFDFGRVHLGLAHSFADKAILAAPSGSSDKTSLQLGYDKVFGGGKWQFTIDGYTGKNAFSAIAPGLIYYMNDKSNVQIGYIRYNDKSIGTVGPSFTRNQIYLGFDYNFGGPKPPTNEAPTPETAPAAPAQN